ncbi:sulfite reductase (NADPH) flavoprotein alpha-component [Bacillus pakistanensis]|uniref:Sulfite reductase (NADPH) flavoprotein alpha-component n=1 Tax=Rossellomorea pakistanensis TaxID=992288 RepID=A0ABS2NCB8_9BACI|nr:assimilatory sulfite reductase (NADPH) flavoprotein subunit [Bacillus pakistanensis]MBM7585460.1 sulfite reductase (NADPH) flavoprotein alpha-component [Bacillus pakistanensis]
MELQVINSPFNEEQAKLLNSVFATLTDSQKVWLSGYLAASQINASLGTTATDLQELPIALSSKTEQVVSKEVTVLFGSQTGNAQGLADKLAAKLEQQGFQVTLSSMNDFKPNRIKKVQNLLILASTHGEGDPPDNALSFYEFLNGKRAPQLNDLQFSVLSLGDSSYEFFCQTGKDFDRRLEELGGKRLCPRVDCDLDFDEPASEWMEDVLSSLKETQKTDSTEKQSSLLSLSKTGTSIDQANYSRTNPFKAEILESVNLNGRGSNKETRHLELSLEGSNLEFEPGDSLGIYPENDPALVDLLIWEMNWDPDEKVSVNKQGDRSPLRDALITHYEITVLTKPLIEKAAEVFSNNDLKGLLSAGNEELRSYIEGRDLLDLVRDFALKEVSASTFISILRKIPPRLYSIASSLKANPDEVHLTIGAVRYNAHKRDRNGVCSVQCAERAQPGDFLPVFIQRNQNFKLPSNHETPIIMIGPGTGIAPFRSFIQEREELEAEGKSWLFFGDQHFVTDFLYQIEWQQWLKNGVLTKMDIAFSRDTEEKVYVQDRMKENSQELYQWLEDGAVVYICGDEKRMAHDVHETLITIIEQEGRMNREQAEDYLTEMQQQKRYQRDVY